MRDKKRTAALAFIFILLFAAVFFFGLILGSASLSPARLLAALHGEDGTAYVILMRLRLPRVLAAALAGAGLAVAGMLLQTVTDNELCAPNIIGVNSGAGFAVMLTLSCFPALWRFQTAAAFLGAMLASSVVLSLSGASHRYSRRPTVILAGVAVSTLFNSGISFLSVRYPDALASYSAFSVGGFSGVGSAQLPIPALMELLGFSAALLLAPKIELLCLGDEAAETLGIRVRALRAATVALCSALCAAVVSFAGLLGFVGLMTPHIINRLVKGSLRLRLPFAALGGAVLVMLSDLAGRVLFSPGELPAGILMAAIGSPFFLFLLLRRGRR